MVLFQGVIFFLIIFLIGTGDKIFFSAFLTISFLKLVSLLLVFLAIFWIGLLTVSINFIVFLKCLVSDTNPPYTIPRQYLLHHLAGLECSWFNII